MVYGNYDLYPNRKIKGYEGCAFEGYESIVKELQSKIGERDKFVIVLETYTQVGQMDFGAIEAVKARQNFQRGKMHPFRQEI